MDVYDEVDRRETDAGRVKVSSEFGVLQLELTSRPDAIGLILCNIICSVAGNTESQHPGDGDDCGAFPPCES